MTTPEAHLATPVQAAWQQAFGGALAPRETPLTARLGSDSKPLWWRRSLRVVRDVAIGFAVIAAIPLTTISVMGSSNWSTNSLRDRVVELARVRPLGVAVDPSISPIAAGEALHRLAPPKPREGDGQRVIVPDVLPWEAAPLDATLFDGRRSTWWAGPNPSEMLTTAPAFSPAEMAWLKAMAEAPMWQDVERVARAKSIDIYGAMLETPLGANSSAVTPFLSTRRLRVIGEAGVARAAYYEAIGQPARAEEALRTIVSFGFAMVDNGIWFLDAMAGRIAVERGRSALRELGLLHGDARLVALAAPFSSKSGVSRVPFAERVENATRDLTDATLPRSFRFEQYSLLRYSTCSTMRGTILGLSDQEEAAVEEARRTLPRFESERGVLDYMDRRFDASIRAIPPGGALRAIVQGAAEVTSAVTGNPRIAACTRMASSSFDSR